LAFLGGNRGHLPPSSSRLWEKRKRKEKGKQQQKNESKTRELMEEKRPGGARKDYNSSTGRNQIQSNHRSFWGGA